MDALAAGRSFDPSDKGLKYLDEHEDAFRRLFVVSAGNIDEMALERDHISRSDVEPVHDPAQAWNALTVGAFTDKVVISDTGWNGWSPVASRGDLSPWSTTSVMFQPTWPIKPEVVFEGGNVVHDAADNVDFPCDDLCLLTTFYKPAEKTLVSTWATSAATAQAEILEPQDWIFPVPIAYGPGRLAEIGNRCAEMELSNPLIVTDHGSRDLPFIARLQGYLTTSGLDCGLFSDISPNPRDDEIGAGREMYRSGGHDAIIAIGGGSAMDGGKAICLTANNDFELWDFNYQKPAPEIGADQPFPVLITIPTTAGTGAETEATAMVTHTAERMKFCIDHPGLRPSLALLDPELTTALPTNLTAWTGADAMTHAIEAYLVPGFNPLCDGMALEALSLIARWLPVVMKQPQNVAARGGMLVGSCLAGVAFLKGLGLVHAISHMVGAEYNTQHGLTNAIILPVVLRYNLPGMEPKVSRMADAMGLEDRSVEAFIAEIERILDDLDIPRSLADIGVPDDCAPRIAEKAMQDSAAGTNPRVPSVKDIQELTEAAITKAR